MPLQNDIAARLLNFLKSNKQEGILFDSAARTTTQTSDGVSINSGNGVVVVLDVTAGTSLSLVTTIERKDPASGKYVTILASTAVTGASTNTYKVFPGATAATNLTVNDCLTGTFRVVVTAGNANSATYSVGYSIV